MRPPAWLSGRFGDPDATHSLRAPRAARPGPLPAGLFAVLIVVLGVLATSRRHPAPPAPAFTALPEADEAALLAAPTDMLSLRRFGADRRIVVAIFPSLHMQAMALNRVAAFIERPGVPHDRLLDDSQLGDAMGRAAETFDTYYYGHDYREADLARFYAVADHDRVALNDAERELRRRLTEAGFFGADMPGALISLPPQGSGLLDPAARTTILHHELSHGAYFTDAAYAAYVASFWRGLAAPQRAAFRHFLGGEGYDTESDDLMRNETQAYLAFTADPRMFDPARIDLTDFSTLRHAFIASVPVPWLRQDADPD